MGNFTKLACVLFISLVYSAPSWSGDARSIGLGGSAIANAKGAHGALENPASMMEMKRDGYRTHFRLGAASDARDSTSAIETLSDDVNQGLFTDIQDQVDELSTQLIQCNPLTGNADDICLTDTQELSDVASQLLDVINLIDDASIDLQAAGDLGVAFTGGNTPFAVNLKVQGTFSARADVDDTDRLYLSEFANLLDNNSLTLDELNSSSFLQANALGIPIGVTQPEDVLQSEGSIGALLRVQIAIAIARTLNYQGRDIDVGLTPKFSTLTASNLLVNTADELNDNAEPLGDQLRNAEVDENSFTFDLGAALSLDNFNNPTRVAIVIRNALTESISLVDGFEFETTPQLIVGGAVSLNRFTLTGDIALNEAKVDNFESQKIAIGAEFGSDKFAFRAGISHDASRVENATAFNIGAGVGPLQIGARLTSEQFREASVQLSYSF